MFGLQVGLISATVSRWAWAGTLTAMIVAAGGLGWERAIYVGHDYYNGLPMVTRGTAGQGAGIAAVFLAAELVVFGLCRFLVRFRWI